MFLIHLSFLYSVSCFYCLPELLFSVLFYFSSILFLNKTVLQFLNSQCLSRTLIISCRTCYVNAMFWGERKKQKQNRAKTLNRNLGLWYITSINSFFYIYKMVIITEICRIAVTSKGVTHINYLKQFISL